MKKNNLSYLLCLTLLITGLIAGLFGIAVAQSDVVTNQAIKVSNAWVRASIPGQTVGAAYMEITSTQNIRLEKVSAIGVGHIEMHSMTMTNGIMKMRMLNQLDLTAGQVYKLAPGGFHLMMFDLKQPFKTGQQVELTLWFRDKAPSEKPLRGKSLVKTNNLLSVKVLAAVKESE